jgi:aminopeptidase N
MLDVRTTTSDTQTIAEAPPSPTHVAIRREDYRPPDWLVPEIALKFTLGIETTRVQAKLTVERNPQASQRNAPLLLNGDGLKPLGVWIDGILSDGWTMQGDDLLIPLEGDAHEVAVDTEINPAANTKLMGLYASNGMLCTQCEAEGFRRITFFPDRPDVLSKYRVRMEGDAKAFPVLLSNGNRVEHGEAADGRHWAEWEDPFPKPCYLFALVAGDLKANRDSFTTMSGRKVDLFIWVREADLPKTQHAMNSLKLAMEWDEKVYGREYDLDQFNIVAVSDFNMGAMENKSLNIFNSAYVLADQETATDADFDNIARVVAHEYFHNWSGDRVTCRDWFQLSLKEGFTVFRDQSFGADVGSAPVKRIEDVRVLRAVQFPEDQGPLAHPVRPDSYIEISNFYTSTVYNKGAEVIRMLATVLGPDKFRAGTDLYFERHDGEAATCDDFVKALEDASGVDLTPFKIWYSQAGTPKVRARLEHDAAAKTATLHLEQHEDPTPGQPVKQPMPIPLKTALIGEQSGHEICPERLIVLDQAGQSVTFDNVVEPPLLSINRNFSAPVIVTAERRPHELERLAQADTDPFARYEAMQELMMAALTAGARGETVDTEPVIRAIGATLKSNALDPAFKGEAILLPSESLIADRMEVVDPDAIHKSREKLRKAILKGLGRAQWRGIWEANTDGSYTYDNAAKGRRRLKNVALAYLMAEHTEYSVLYSWTQYNKADNMTDRLGALSLLASTKFGARTQALKDFYDRYRQDDLVLDKWFAIQAAAQQPETVDQVIELANHPDFVMTNPNRLRSLTGTFGANHWAFHLADGRGYAFLADMIIAADKLNPQIAARLVPPFGRWRRFEPKRAELMRQSLERIVATPGLSKDVFEQVSKSLA